jgi:hypothetical protein
LAARPLRRLGLGRRDGGEGVVARGVDREDAVEAGDLEDLGDVLVGADQGERAAGGAEALDAADEDAERRRVDEGG